VRRTRFGFADEWAIYFVHLIDMILRLWLSIWVTKMEKESVYSQQAETV